MTVDSADLANADFLRSLAHELDVHRNASPFPLWASDIERILQIANRIDGRKDRVDVAEARQAAERK
jgi:hypothetical protein